MNWNYENYIISELIAIQKEEGLSDYNFKIETEQAFIKRKDYNENTIYIVIKYLADTKSVSSTMQPIQFLILTEQNSLDVTKVLFDKFATSHNWTVAPDTGTEYIKQQYTSPVVLSNFNPVLYGYRSVMYMTATLYIMEDIVDFGKVSITTDNEEVEVDAINLALSYSMSTNTQQIKSEEIASSEKTVSTLSITLSIPMKSSTLITKILGIINETEEGNDDFVIKLYEDSDDSTPTISKTMKLISAQITTAVNQIPSIQIGFMK